MRLPCSSTCSNICYGWVARQPTVWQLGVTMEVVHERCCGLDVHKDKLTACVLIGQVREVRTFGTMTRDLLQLADWLTEEKVTHVAMESTAVYWKPVYNLLEDQFSVLVVNARHIKKVPGRKTDVSDAEWIADLLRHGLIRGSYIPERPQRELRELVRYRRRLSEQRAQVVNRMQKVLEAMVQGVDNPEALAGLAKGKLREKRAQLQEALHGLMGPHQRMMLESQLRHLDFLDEEIARLDEEVSKRMRPFDEVIQRIDGIPGIGRRLAERVLAEIGVDMTRFASAEHLASWAGICPGNNESAGKRRSGRTGRGNPWLRCALVEAAWGANRTRETYLRAQFRRIAARRGNKRAALAVAHTILNIIYYMLQRGTTYEDLGGNYFDQRHSESIAHRAVLRLERLGYKVILKLPEPASTAFS